MFSKGDIHRYIKICSISLVNRKCKANHNEISPELVRRAIIKKRRQCWRGYGEKGGNVNWGSH